MKQAEIHAFVYTVLSMYITLQENCVFGDSLAAKHAYY